MSLQKVTTLAAITASLLLAGCEKQSDQDIITDAQYCLDDATDAASANACIAKLGGINSAAANVLRCSAAFIGQGFADPQVLTDALDSLDNPSGGASGTEAFLSVMVFSSTSAADSALTSCSASGQKALAMFGAMAKSATYIAQLGLGTTANMTPADINTAVNNLIANGNADTVIGEAVLTVYEATCQTGSAANQSLCGPLDDALASLGPNPTAQQIGDAVLAQWANQ